MTAHTEAIAAYRTRIGAVDQPQVQTVSEPEDPTAGMGRCNDCTGYRGGYCTTAATAWGTRRDRIEIGPNLAAMSQHCAGFARKDGQ
jgi:hypothetical protein